MDRSDESGEPDGEILTGGNVTPVLRIGNTVRRQTGPWSTAVHALLRHLASVGFDGAPRVLGIDQEGREVLSYLDGHVGHHPLPGWMWSDDVLVEAARLLRRYHDATAGFVAPANTEWRTVYGDTARHEVICHHDIAPYNTVYRDERPVAFIDFDFAGPGPRVWDLAYAAYRFVPLSNEPDVRDQGHAGVEWQQRRLRLMRRSYGPLPGDDLVETVIDRLQHLCAFLEDQDASGDPTFGQHVADGHLALYRRDVAFVTQRRHLFDRALDG